MPASIETKIHAPENAPEIRSVEPKRRVGGSLNANAETFNRALQARLRRLREQANLTQTEVAEALGMPSRSYQHFEARSPLPAHLILAFAQIVGCSIEDVLID